MADSGNAPKRPVRSAIYTRKSTEEGLDQDFNSLDAQRERLLSLSGDHRYLSESEVRRVSEEIDWQRQLILFDQLEKNPIRASAGAMV